MKRRTLITVTALCLLLGGILLFLDLRNRKQAPSAFLLDRTETLGARDDYRQGMRLTAGKTATLQAAVPHKGFLSFSVAIPKTDWASEVEPYRVVVQADDQTMTEEFRPSTHKEDRIWRDFHMDLSRQAGRTVKVQFRLDAPAGKTAFISRPKIVNPMWEKQKPNVLIISIDTLRKDHLSVYGYARPTSPNIDRFAQTASVFTHAYSAATTTAPSITSLLTSTCVSEHGVTDNRSVFDNRFPTLPQLLNHQGYATVAFVGNAVLRPSRRLNAGFDVYNAFLPGTEINRRLPERNAAQLTRAATTWLEEHDRERFFLWLHYQDPHAPYTPPEELHARFDPVTPSGKALPPAKDYTGEGGIPDYARLPGITDPDVYVARYDEEILFADQQIGRLLARMRDLGLLERTMVVITADHGESLGENNHYFTHGHNVTPELTDVPLLIYVPGRRPQPFRDPVSLIDVAPTLLELLALPAPRTFAGRSLFLKAPDREVIAEQANVRWAWIGPKGRYIYEHTGHETYLGELDPQPANRKRANEWIAAHLPAGILFAFTGVPASGTINSDRRLESAILFGAEQDDRISIGDSSVQLGIHADPNETDCVLIQTEADATLSLQGIDLRDIHHQPVQSPFRTAAIPAGSKIPELHQPGVVVMRKEATRKAPPLTREEEEELKSLGYVGE
jgi:arylsulfatase A-like enzyme